MTSRATAHQFDYEPQGRNLADSKGRISEQADKIDAALAHAKSAQVRTRVRQDEPTDAVKQLTTLLLNFPHQVDAFRRQVFEYADFFNYSHADPVGFAHERGIGDGIRARAFLDRVGDTLAQLGELKSGMQAAVADAQAKADAEFSLTEIPVSTDVTAITNGYEQYHQVDRLWRNMAIEYLDRTGLLDDETSVEAIDAKIKRDPKNLLELIDRIHEEDIHAIVSAIGERGFRTAAELDESRTSRQRVAANHELVVDKDRNTANRLSATLDAFTPLETHLRGFHEELSKVIARVSPEEFPLALRQNRQVGEAAFAVGTAFAGFDKAHLEMHGVSRSRAEESELPDLARAQRAQIEQLEAALYEAGRTEYAAGELIQVVDNGATLAEQRILRAELVRRQPERFPEIVSVWGDTEPEDPQRRTAWNDAVGRSSLIGGLIGHGQSGLLFPTPKGLKPNQKAFFDKEVAALKADADVLGISARIVTEIPSPTVGQQL